MKKEEGVEPVREDAHRAPAAPFDFSELEAAPGGEIAPSEEGPDWTCADCGAINKCRTVLVSSPMDPNEYDIECLDCGSRSVHESPREALEESLKCRLHLEAQVEALQAEVADLKGLPSQDAAGVPEPSLGEGAPFCLQCGPEGLCRACQDACGDEVAVLKEKLAAAVGALRSVVAAAQAYNHRGPIFIAGEMERRAKEALSRVEGK